MAFTVLTVLSIIALVASIIPFLRIEGWWVRGFDFPRLQFAFLAAALLVADLLLLDMSEPRGWALVAIATVCLCIQAWWIVPYTRLFPVEIEDTEENDAENTVCIMTANVLQPNRKARELLELVEDNSPDILVALETNQWWQDQLDRLETSGEYPYAIKCPLDNLYGMLVYSKLPLENAKTQFLVQDGVPSMHALAILRSGRKVRVHFLHPAPPSPSENEESSERDAELLVVARSTRHAQSPAIVTGDLNDVAWSATTRLFRKASGFLDPRIGRGMFNTFHAQRWYLRWPLDHLFCSSHFQLKAIKRLPEFGSDHFPMLMELVCRHERLERQEGLEADKGDREWIQEKIDDESVKVSDVHEPDK